MTTLNYITNELSLNRIRLLFLTTLSIFLTLLPAETVAGQFQKIGKIVCTETSFNDDNTVTANLGTVTVTLGSDGKASLIEVKRIRASALPAINNTFSIASSTITHQVVNSELETITATDPKGRTLNLKINDHMFAGKTGSSYSYEDGKVFFATRDETTTVSCEGEIKFPTNN